MQDILIFNHNAERLTMPYDFNLESENEKRMFSDKTLEEMQRYLYNVPHYRVDEKLYFIFENNERKDVAIPKILSDIAQNRNIYAYSCVVFKPTSIIISIIGDVDVDRYIYDFVVWCQKHFPCQLYEGSEAVPPEELLFEEEFEIPQIN